MRAHGVRAGQSWLVAMALALVASGCSAAAAPTPSSSGPSDAVTTPEATAPESAEATGAVQPLDPGGLEAGTRYVAEGLGVSFVPDADGWFAVMPQGGDVALSRGDVTVYFYRPETILAPDGSQIAAPADPQALLDAIHATDIANVGATEAFEASGISGRSAEIESLGGSEAAPLMTTGSGSLGLAEGEFQWIVIAIDGSALVISVERPDDPDIDAAWEIAGPLVESLEAAP
jgi:hypothetical protein